MITLNESHVCSLKDINRQHFFTFFEVIYGDVHSQVWSVLESEVRSKAKHTVVNLITDVIPMYVPDIRHMILDSKM
jgi:hypothetical protein